jgi:hypothetical protein
MNGSLDAQPLLTSHSRHGPIAKIPRTRRWRATNYGCKVIGTSLCLREHHVPSVYSGATR